MFQLSHGKTFLLIFNKLNVIAYDRSYPLTLLAPTPQNGQTHSNKLSAKADELFECVWQFFGVGA